MNALDKAIELAGGQAPLGRIIGVSQQRISYWATRNMQIPAEYVPKIVAAFEGRITKHELRPDLWEDSPVAVATGGSAQVIK